MLDTQFIVIFNNVDIKSKSHKPIAQRNSKKWNYVLNPFFISRNEDFLETVPKAKLRRVKWMPMFNCLKQGILNEMVQELSSMWEYENMPHKLAILEKQKEKFMDMETDNALW